MVDFLGLSPFALGKIYIQTGALGPRAGFESTVYEKAALQNIPKPDIQKIFSGPEYEQMWKRLEEKAPLPPLVNAPSPHIPTIDKIIVDAAKNVGSGLLGPAIIVIALIGGYMLLRRKK